MKILIQTTLKAVDSRPSWWGGFRTYIACEAIPILCAHHFYTAHLDDLDFESLEEAESYWASSKEFAAFKIADSLWLKKSDAIDFGSKAMADAIDTMDVLAASDISRKHDETAFYTRIINMIPENDDEKKFLDIAKKEEERQNKEYMQNQMADNEGF